jgi:hypothetical protein
LIIFAEIKIWLDAQGPGLQTHHMVRYQRDVVDRRYDLDPVSRYTALWYSSKTTANIVPRTWGTRAN